MSFSRHDTRKWHREVPGTRWFKADLHVHTIDDHPGKRVRWPQGISGDPADPGVLASYARVFLQGVIRAGIQVLGLTPHSARAGSEPSTSAVWHIVDTWNNGTDDDGEPFRDKIFAVFPGFEPNVNNGASGVHLLFLFDPEIGRDDYLRLFDALMDGRSPWEQDRGLRLTTRDASAIFDTIDERREERTGSDRAWDYLALAAHFQSHHGLLHEVQKQVLETFPCHRLAGWELGDEKLPDDFDESSKPGSFLLRFMKEQYQAFFHASDAYGLSTGEPPTEGCVGHRYTWVKMASPRIGSLRQAFIASDSRLRIAFERDAAGGLRELAQAPDVTESERPWLRTITVRGGASFFGGRKGDDPRETRVELSPDLTCIIGGSMTGKSTLLDGLRVHVGADLPKNADLAKGIVGRAELFLAGSPEIDLDCPGSDPTAPLHERWPAVFYTQNELQRLAQDGGAVEEILARLIPAETAAIEARRSDLDEVDQQLHGLAQRLARLDEQVADAEQAHQRASDAKEELEAFDEAGMERLQEAARGLSRWGRASEKGESLLDELRQIRELAAALEAPELDDAALAAIDAAGITPPDPTLTRRHSDILQDLEEARRGIATWTSTTKRIEGALKAHEAELRTTVERKLAEQGLDASKLKEFQALSQQASMLVSYEANSKEVQARQLTEERAFSDELRRRGELVAEQRRAFERVLEAIQAKFDGRIRARVLEASDCEPLDAFLRDLGKKGVTRWWNATEDRPRSEELLARFKGGSLGEVGMSLAVQERFREAMTRQKQRELEALRCADRYALEARVDNEEYRDLDELSGGQRVSVLLSLLLETSDNRPLVIDQPEDELDNKFLFGTVLPVLQRLKGTRQVIVATHNANIVVNGDADMVIQLAATAHQGWVAHAGAIEQREIRDAIVQTVDGGDDAFQLRKAKYGF